MPVAALSVFILSTALSYVTYPFERWRFRVMIKKKRDRENPLENEKKHEKFWRLK